MASYRQMHPWDLKPREAAKLQKELREQLQLVPYTRPINTIAGTDISFDKGSDRVYAGVVVLSVPDLCVVEQRVVITEATFPYVPGLLSFRETPPLLQAWSLLRCEPDAVMLDGHGYAHPRRCGFASHFGLLVERPTLGCAKTVLVGSFEPPSTVRGNWTPLVDKEEVIGAALRTKRGASPVFISSGDRIDVESAVAIALRCTASYRIPSRPAGLTCSLTRHAEESCFPTPETSDH